MLAQPRVKLMIKHWTLFSLDLSQKDGICLCSRLEITHFTTVFASNLLSIELDAIKISCELNCFATGRSSRHSQNPIGRCCWSNSCTLDLLLPRKGVCSCWILRE